MDTKNKILSSLMPLLASGASKIKLVAIFSSGLQGLALIEVINARELLPANIIGVIVANAITSILWKQAAFLQQFQQTNDIKDFENALNQEAIYWKSTSILMVLSFIGSIILILFPF